MVIKIKTCYKWEDSSGVINNCSQMSSDNYLTTANPSTLSNKSFAQVSVFLDMFQANLKLF